MDVSTVGRKSIFAGAIKVMLSDGYLSVDEKRMILKLASIIGLDEETPLKIYEAVVEGENIEDGENLSPEEQLSLYSQMLVAVLTDDDISEDELNVVKYIARVLDIQEDEHKRCYNEAKGRLRTPPPQHRTVFLSNLLSDVGRITGNVGRITSNLFGVRKKPHEQNNDVNEG